MKRRDRKRVELGGSATSVRCSHPDKGQDAGYEAAGEAIVCILIFLRMARL